MMFYMRENIPKEAGRFFKNHTQPCYFRKQKQGDTDRLAQAIDDAVRKAADALKGERK